MHISRLYSLQNRSGSLQSDILVKGKRKSCLCYLKHHIASFHNTLTYWICACEIDGAQSSHNCCYAATKDPLITRYDVMLMQTTVFSEYRQLCYSLWFILERDASDITVMKRGHILYRICYFSCFVFIFSQ